MLFTTLLLPSLIAAASIYPAPIVISPSQYWEGNDGPWSTFTIQVGTPAQNVRVLISTAGFTTWVVLPEGCPNDGIADCTNLRGDVYQASKSSTWRFEDYFDLVLESQLGYEGTAAFGYDKVAIGWQGDGGPVLENQVIAGIATEDFWLGSFGLTPRPTNFSDFNNPQPSFMQTLQNQSLIPSLSWSYTAGAPYRLNKVPGSLVFGGYDASKAGTKNLTFEFGPDISRDLTVGLQKITMSSEEKDIDLLPAGIFTFIDSTVPHIWLPKEACVNFEKALGLSWNSTIGLYIVNDTLHEKLSAQNASFTFTIGSLTDGEPTIDVTLPYASFDLSVEYPIVPNKTRYFPIIRAANDTQYTLGRTFLQESYLTVDYERSQFYLSQTRFDQGANELIIAIPSTHTTITESAKRKSITPRSIVGIVIGSLAGVGAFVVALCILIRRRRPKEEQPPAYPTDRPASFHKAELDAGDTSKPGHEIEGTAVEFYQPVKEEQSELPESSVASPVSQNSVPASLPRPVYEMIGDQPILQELPVSAAGKSHGENPK